MKFKRGLLNITIGLAAQMGVLILGIIIPRLFIMNYGSEVNGLLNSITQMYSYLALMEAGIGQACVNALYKPIVKNQEEYVSAIVNAANMRYRRSSVYYLLGICSMAILYPMMIQSGLDKRYVGLVIFFMGAGNVINFYFSMAIKQLMVAEGKTYIITNISFFIHIIRYVIQIAFIYAGFDILRLQIAVCLVASLQCLILRGYFHKNYRWFRKDEPPAMDELKQSTAFLIHQISSLVFANTDTIILTFFVGLYSVSVYSVYNMVMTAVNVLCDTLNNGLSFLLGQIYHEDRPYYIKLHYAYHTFYTTFMFAIITVCYVLFMPFIRFYTLGADINYEYRYLPLMFCVIQLLSSTRAVSNNLIKIAGHTGKTVCRSLTEAAVNIAVSLFAVRRWGMYGVLAGTIVALLYRANDIILYAEHKLMKRPPGNIYMPVVVNGLIFCMFVLLRETLDVSIGSFTGFLCYGFIYTVAILSIYFAVICLLFRRDRNFVWQEIRKRLGKGCVKKGR